MLNCLEDASKIVEMGLLWFILGSGSSLGSGSGDDSLNRWDDPSSTIEGLFGIGAGSRGWTSFGESFDDGERLGDSSSQSDRMGDLPRP